MTVMWHHEHGVHTRYVAPNRARIALALCGAALVLGVIGGGAWFFWTGWKSGAVPVFCERLAFVPVGYADGHVLWFADIARLAHGIAAADARTQVTETDYMQAIDGIIRQHALEDIAREYHVVAGGNDENDTYTRSAQESFQALAGWSGAEYETYITAPLLLSRAVERVVLHEEVFQQQARARRDALREKLNSGIAFADVAREYSEDPVTAQTQGSFGYVLPGDVDAAFLPVFSLPLNTISDDIITDDAYWLLRSESTVRDESGMRFLLRGIAVKKETLAHVLDESVANIVPYVWVR